MVMITRWGAILFSCPVPVINLDELKDLEAWEHLTHPCGTR